MESQNQTVVVKFLLLGLSQNRELQPILFGLLLTMYLATVLGNLLIILAVSLDTHLHTPMFFFLCNLSWADIGCTSNTVPKMLLNIQIQNKTISYPGCLIQVCFYLLFVCMDNLLLTVMAYDRYVAICHPLNYMIIMNPSRCVFLVLVSLCTTITDSLLRTLMLLCLSFCTDLEIPHFCEFPQILKLSCSDTLINNIIVYLTTILLGIIPFFGIMFSYSQIVSSILRIPSSGGKYKAFSTCGSHPTVVSLFYGNSIGVYLSSAVTDSPGKTAVASVMYNVVTPMMSPFIYSLRNKDLKRALRKLTFLKFSF